MTRPKATRKTGRGKILVVEDNEDSREMEAKRRARRSKLERTPPRRSRSTSRLLLRQCRI